MRYLAMMAAQIVCIVILALSVYAAHVCVGGYLPEVDEEGWRCEGDCDPDVPCRFCNP